MPSEVSDRKILLIDDDPIFCALIGKIADARGYRFDRYHSLEEMGSFVRIKDYAVVLIDYDLGALNGFEIAEYVDVFFPHLPVLIVSGYDEERLKAVKWPRCIRSFLSKGVGPYGIVNTATSYLNEYQQPHLS